MTNTIYENKTKSKPWMLSNVNLQWWHGGVVISTVALQQDGSGFKLVPRVQLHGFTPGASVSSTDMQIGSNGNSKLLTGAR